MTTESTTAETTAPVSAERVQAGVNDLLERGYTVIERSLSPEECQVAAGLLDEIVASGQAVEYDGAGYFIHPLLSREGRLADFYSDPLALAILEKLFGGAARLAHSGARVSDSKSAPRIGWHQHMYQEEREAVKTDKELRGEYPVRVLIGWYLEGCSPESGPLIVYPRRYDDLLTEPSDEMTSYWPGEVEVSCAPGSCVIFTTDLWHAAKAGTNTKRRYLMGSHFQGWNNARPHVEDHAHEGPEIDAACERNPLFKKMIKG
jgi:hypothetical protein